MTGEQAKWLRDNRPYVPLGQRPGFGASYVRVGMLHPDGEFELKVKGVKQNVHVGSFEVGILERK